MTRRLILCLTSPIILAGMWFASSAAEPVDKPFPADQVAFYVKEVRPILEMRCLKCHGGEKTRGNLALTSRADVLAGGDLGAAVSLETPSKSLLLLALTHSGELKMPPKEKLPPAEVAILTRWVAMGLPWSPGGEKSTPAPRGNLITAEARNFWAYRPVAPPPLPKVQNTSWPRGPIDTYLLARLEAKGLTPGGEADRLTLIRRATYDLTGLPPTPEEVDAFIADPRPDAYEKLLDRLLDSPQYGEAWGRHWLDLVRYAETNGYERDGPKPYAWRFRDYVIKSFNTDKPYDRFLTEQLAGDEIPGENPDAIIATGYYRLGLWDDEPADAKQARADELDDWVATTCQVFLGMTMNCARCHEHKRDPIPQADYYRFVAFFEDVERYSNNRDVRSSFNLSDITPPERRKLYEDSLKKREARIAELTTQMEKIEDEAIRLMPAEDQRAAEANDRPEVVKKVPGYLKLEQRQQYQALKKERDGLKRLPDVEGRELALSINNGRPRPPTTHVFIRGNPHAPAMAVEPAFPTVLGFAAPKIPVAPREAKSSGRRTVLAQWIASPENPLTARVFVNRVWQHHFGRGLVPTPSDFGKLGELPTHPELLDWLARDFMSGGWRLKRLHKVIMTSAAYRMSSKASNAGMRLDPANTLLWRYPMRRLTAEEVRDSVLAASGQLNLKAGGASVYPLIPREVLAGQSRPGEGWGRSSQTEASRRSVYVYVKRSLLVPVLSQHDQADTDSSCPVRYTTTVPTQALGMLNGEFTNEQAEYLARRLRAEAPSGLAAQVTRAIRLTTGRKATAEEVAHDVAFVERLRERHGLGDHEALRQYALLTLNANEFIYLD